MQASWQQGALCTDMPRSTSLPHRLPPKTLHRRVHGALSAFTQFSLTAATAASAFAIHRLVWLAPGDICSDEGAWGAHGMLGQPHKCRLVRANQAAVRVGTLVALGVLSLIDCGVKSFLEYFRLLSRPLFKALSFVFVALLTASDRAPFAEPTACNVACWLLLAAALLQFTVGLLYADRIRVALRSHRRRHREGKPKRRWGHRERGCEGHGCGSSISDGAGGRDDGAADGTADGQSLVDTLGGGPMARWRDALVAGLLRTTIRGAASEHGSEFGSEYGSTDGSSNSSARSTTGLRSEGPSSVDTWSTGRRPTGGRSNGARSAYDSAFDLASDDGAPDGSAYDGSTIVGYRGLSRAARSGRLWEELDPEGTLDLSAHQAWPRAGSTAQGALQGTPHDRHVACL